MAKKTRNGEDGSWFGNLFRGNVLKKKQQVDLPNDGLTPEKRAVRNTFPRQHQNTDPKGKNVVEAIIGENKPLNKLSVSELEKIQASLSDQHTRNEGLTPEEEKLSRDVGALLMQERTFEANKPSIQGDPLEHDTTPDPFVNQREGEATENAQHETEEESTEKQRENSEDEKLFEQPEPPAETEKEEDTEPQPTVQKAPAAQGDSNPKNAKLGNGDKVSRNKGDYPYNEDQGRFANPRELEELAGQDVAWAKEALAKIQSGDAPAFVTPAVAGPTKEISTNNEPLMSDETAEKVAASFKELEEKTRESKDPETSSAEKAQKALGYLGKKSLEYGAEGSKFAGKVGLEGLKRINDVVDKLPPGSRLVIGVALMGAVMVSGPAGWGAVPLVAKALWTVASMEKISRKIRSKKDSLRYADAGAQFTLAGIGLAFLLASAFGVEDAVAEVVPVDIEAGHGSDNAITSAGADNESAFFPNGPVAPEGDISPETTNNLALATDSEILAVQDNPTPPVVTPSDIGLTSTEPSISPVEEVAKGETEIGEDLLEQASDNTSSNEAVNDEALTAEEVAAQIGNANDEQIGTGVPEVNEVNSLEREALEPTQDTTEQQEVTSSQEAMTPTIEIPVDVSVTARPGDGAITMLMQWAETATEAGHTFPEGTPMAELVEAQNQGGLYEVAQQIAIDQGLYQPDAANESFNVFEGATLETTQNADGAFSFTLSNPGGESYSLWSSVNPEVPAYSGPNMIDTDATDPSSSSASSDTSSDTSVAESRLLSQEAIEKYQAGGAWQSAPDTSDPTVISTEEVSAQNNDKIAVDDTKEGDGTATNFEEPTTSVDHSSNNSFTTASETAERAFALQGEVANLTEASWQTLSSQPLPEIFLDPSATASERAGALIELAGQNAIALDEEGASQLENLITMMQSSEMSRTYGEVSLAENGTPRTLHDILVEGFRNRELSQ